MNFTKNEIPRQMIDDIKLSIYYFGLFTLHNCWPVDSSSNGCLEKHLEQANKTTCELIVRFVVVIFGIFCVCFLVVGRSRLFNIYALNRWMLLDQV